MPEIWEIISNLWEAYGPNMDTAKIILYIVGGLAFGLPILGKVLDPAMKAKIGALLGRLNPFGRSTGSAQASSDDMETLLVALASLTRKRNKTAVTAIHTAIDAIPEEKPVVPVELAK